MENLSSPNSPIALIAYTPSHAITDMTAAGQVSGRARYKSPGAREIYTNAVKEKAALQQKIKEKEVQIQI